MLDGGVGQRHGAEKKAAGLLEAGEGGKVTKRKGCCSATRWEAALFKHGAARWKHHCSTKSSTAGKQLKSKQQQRKQEKGGKPPREKGVAVLQSGEAVPFNCDAAGWEALLFKQKQHGRESNGWESSSKENRRRRESSQEKRALQCCRVGSSAVQACCS